MCGIAGLLSLDNNPIKDVNRKLTVMNDIQKHRGPDGHGTWVSPDNKVGLAHRRLSIIDLGTGAQPMNDGAGNWITYNGEIYNYIELREELGKRNFHTTSDTEVILHAYRKWGNDCVKHFRGMFAFALWDNANRKLFCARDRFGIKPFCYAEPNGTFIFASEAKTILPFLPSVETDPDSLKDYLTFQFCLDGKTLFKGIRELQPGHTLEVSGGKMDIKRYWEVFYDLDWKHTAPYFEEKLQELLNDSVKIHLRSDVPVGAYLSGGIDSSIVASMAHRHHPAPLEGFNGRFDEPGFDESKYAQAVADQNGFHMHAIDIGVNDFLANIKKIIYHMDYPVAGPGSFPQYMVSGYASKHRKVLLGGQGGDEIFGGYARYLIAYFEQCIKSAIEGTTKSGNFVVTYESIIPNLVTLKEYKPMLQEFWKEGLFEDMDKRYFRLVDRTHVLKEEVRWDRLGSYSPYDTFRSTFYGDNVGHESYFDLMTHFDFKTLLPALLHVEDRVSMAHGLESRVPLLDHPLVEMAATMPANVKFKNGSMKIVLRNAIGSMLPPEVLNRRDKMGFPVPLNKWLAGPARDFAKDTLSSRNALGRPYINNASVAEGLDREPKYGRKMWGLLCLELWQSEFHDRAHEMRKLVN